MERIRDREIIRWMYEMVASVLVMADGQLDGRGI
jgi:hypothetical protein